MNKAVLAASIPLAFLLAVPAAFADVCTAPGDIVLEDAAGDAGFQGLIPVPSPVGDSYDLVALSVAAPAAAKGEDRKLIFTINLAAQQPTPGMMIPGTAIYSSFIDPKKQIRGVRVQSDNMGGMTFFSYLAGPSSGTGGSPVTDGRFVTAGSERPAEPESSYAGGVATIVVRFKDIKLDEDGGIISGFNAATTQAVSVPGAGGVAGTMDTMPDDLVHSSALEITKCSGKSAEARSESVVVADKSATSFGGAFGLLNLLLLLPMALRRRSRR